MIDNVIYTLLSTDTDVSALVGDRIFPNQAVEDVEYPYITFKLEEREPTDTKDGKSCLDSLLYEIEIWTKKPLQSKDLALKVQNVLDRFTGTVDGDEIDSSKMMATETGYDDQDRVYLIVQMYVFRHKTIFGILKKATDLTATGASSSQINLAWTDNATGETGYEVWSSIDCINWTLITTTAPNATTFNDTGLSAGASFAYRVRPITATTESSWSNIDIGATTGAAASGIAYPFVYLTGQLISYASDDDGDNLANGVYSRTNPISPTHVAQQDFNSVTPFIKLIANNREGNKDRFTDDVNGGQVYTSDVIEDHLTNLDWYRVVQGSSFWAAAVSGAASLVAGGHSDWYLPNTLQFSSIIQQNVTDRCVQYSPFNQNVSDDFWTSTTRPDNTLRAYAVDGNTCNIGGFIKTTTLRVYIVVRNH